MPRSNTARAVAVVTDTPTPSRKSSKPRKRVLKKKTAPKASSKPISVRAAWGTSKQLKNNPDYYLRGRERLKRRERWEWPDEERHPEVNIHRSAYADSWRVILQQHDKEKARHKLFTDAIYGGREKALAAAIAWRDAEYEKNPYRRMGWKLSPDKAGNVVVLEYRGRKIIRARLVHDGIQLEQRFSVNKYGLAAAQHAAECALEIWRDEIKKVCAMSRREQEKLAARGGFVTRKDFPAKREQMELGLS